jgi:tetraacyldisaccharide 4'-kinase
MKLLRIIAFPLSVLYGTLLGLRNKLYDWGIFSSTTFQTPIISVGNLSVGGTGKTPHIEYLIRLLNEEFKVATLSRGYGRKTKGFVLANAQSTATDVGDEPLQFKSKYPEIPVVVDEKRVRGVKKILEKFPSIDIILLDDAFQHRAIKPGLSIVLTDFNNLYFDDFVMPTGTLREFRSGIKRADIIIVTKCPEILVPIERQQIEKKINPLPKQHVYFSHIKYGEFLPFHAEKLNPFSKAYYFERHYSILLLTGIANTQPLEYYLKEKSKNLVPVQFPDHHVFTATDIEQVKKIFDNIASANKIILTTEKDAMRLKCVELSAALEHLPLFYIPIEIDFYDKNKGTRLSINTAGQEFNEQILHYVRTNQEHGSLHSK